MATPRRRFKLIVIFNLFFGLGFGLLPAASAAESAPIITSILPGNTYLEVEFTAASGNPSFYQYSINAGTSWVTPTVPVTGSPLTIHNLTNGTAYSVKLRAVYSGVIGLGSESASATPTTATQNFNGQAFLQGAYSEVGVRANGAFGSSTVPNGFHGNTGSCLGFRVDRLRNGWEPSSTTDDGDFFCPGNPYEAWGVSVDGQEYINSYAGGPMVGQLSPVSIGVEDQSVSWDLASGGPADLEISQTYKVPNQGQEIIIDVTLTNSGLTPMSDIFYSRAVDPDNQASVNNVFMTQNTINIQGGTTAGAAVTSTFSNGGNLSLFSNDLRARVALAPYCCGSTPINGSAIWNQTGNWSTPSPYYMDSDIGLAVKIATLSAGASVTFSLRYYLTSEAASAVIPTLPQPEFGNVAPSSNGFRVPISNFDPTVTYTLVATDGSASLDASSGIISVTELSPGQSSTITVIARKNNFNDASGSISANALAPGVYAIQYSGPNSLDYGVTAQVTNFDDTYSWSVTSTSGQARISSSGLVTISGIRVDAEVSFTITASKNGFITSVIVLGKSQVAPMIPTGAPKLTTENGVLTCSIGLYSAQPTSTIFSIWINGSHKSTIFSSLGDYLPDWIASWASAETISRDGGLRSASWKLLDDWKGQTATCTTLAYSNSATGSVSTLGLKLS